MFFSAPNLGGCSVDRHQIFAHVRGWAKFIKLGEKFEPLSEKKLEAPKHQNLRQISNKSQLDRRYLQKQEGPADARVTSDSAVIPRWLSAAILDIIEPEIVPCDDAIRWLRKPLPIEPDMEWIGCTISEIFDFKLYCDLETGVRPLWGHWKSSNEAPLDRPTPKTRP